MRRLIVPLLALLCVLPLSTPAAASPAPDVEAQGLTTPLTRPVWLCKPGQADNPCLTGRYPDGYHAPLDTTVVRPDGSTAVQPPAPAGDPGVDCFYAYPTVNLLSNPILLLGANPPYVRDPEVAVTLTQLRALAGHCRLFVPLYRQAPLTSYLLSILAPPDFETGYQDVKQAFAEYWATENQGRRGVIVLGHSQGAAAAARLLQEEFDGVPARTDKLVGAYLAGTGVRVALGGGNDAGSTFRHLPACTRPSPAAPVPSGCVVAYASYDLDGADPRDAVLAKDPDAGHEMLCVNPAQLLTGGQGRLPIRPWLPTRKLTKGGSLDLLMGDYQAPDYPTGFAAYPGRMSAECVRDRGATWLEIDGNEPFKSSHAQLGLHVLDYSLPAGDLADLLGAQTAAWRQRHGG
ncbi:DUF3089 domain-containing protein [Nonomuraea sp. NPDC050310]|uniref:DUF3089 domain-containing protein n=1 Tax=Nonomuraea sp. NPDC050310 TaxID=3154935 RepID=UPI003411D1FE